jgi:thiol-disulfide isomerase/thioredoxin
MFLRNAEEKITVEDITMQADSIRIRMPLFDSEIAAVHDKNGLRGVWIKHLADSDQRFAFQAIHGEDFRFEKHPAPARYNAGGRWAVLFQDPKTGDSTACVGEFVQHGNRLTGTFLHPTGDYRFLEGEVSGDSIKLSCFDGAHAYLFTARMKNGDSLVGGRYYAGLTHVESWSARKDPQAKLPDEFSLTQLRPGHTQLNFAFQDINGDTVSIRDKRFTNKVVLVELMGSWCPNCMDESRFLAEFYKKYKDKNVEIVGLAFERSTDFRRAQKNLQNFVQRLQVPYPLLITGVSVDDTAKTEKALPQLEKIEGFPTTIFIDKSGNVQKILTGFNGPATGPHYQEEKKVFQEIVDKLLVE